MNKWKESELVRSLLGFFLLFLLFVGIHPAQARNTHAVEGVSLAEHQVVLQHPVLVCPALLELRGLLGGGAV